jgi:DNA-binding transcriptional regulator WhiA
MIKKDLVIKYSKGIDRALNELTEICDLRDNPKISLNDIADLTIDLELYRG